jgi:hypothetical protein
MGAETSSFSSPSKISPSSTWLIALSGSCSGTSPIEADKLVGATLELMLLALLAVINYFVLMSGFFLFLRIKAPDSLSSSRRSSSSCLRSAYLFVQWRRESKTKPRSCNWAIRKAFNLIS